MTATTTVTYRDWNWSFGEPHDRPAYDEAGARRRFEAERGLWVLFGDPDKPDVVLNVELGGRVAEAMWLDELRRPTLSYVFGQADDCPDDELFLEQTRIRGYEHDRPLPEGRATYNEVWTFRRDGRFHATRGKRGELSEQSEGRLDPEQLETLRERRPAFGEWDSLIRFER